MRKQAVTRHESKAAMEAQAPISQDKPQALATQGIFNSLMSQPTVDARQMLGGDRTDWINAMDEENPLFPTGGNFSRPFFILRAWFFQSKNATQKDRMGIKLATPDNKVWHISLSYPFNDAGDPMYPDRAVILDHFNSSTTAIGLIQFEKVDRGQNHPYWRMIFSDEHSMELAGEAMPEKPTGDPNEPF